MFKKKKKPTFNVSHLQECRDGVVLKSDFIIQSNNNSIYSYLDVAVKDIPKLIKALQDKLESIK